MTNKNSEDPTYIFSWKVSLPLTAHKVIEQLLTISIDKDLIKNEKELTIYFVRDIIVEKYFGDALSFTDGYGKEDFMNA